MSAATPYRARGGGEGAARPRGFRPTGGYPSCPGWGTNPRLAAANARLIDGDQDVAAVMAATRELEAERKAAGEELAAVRRQAAPPRGEAWGECKGLVGALDSAPNPRDARVRLRAVVMAHPAPRRVHGTVGRVPPAGGPSSAGSVVVPSRRQYTSPVGSNRTHEGRPAVHETRPFTPGTVSSGETTAGDPNPLEPVGAAPAVPGYELGDRIGRGGMGDVYRARDLELDREVAVKVLQDRYSLDSPAAARFVAEARVTARLQHPGIPAVYRVAALADGRPFLAMKLIKGRTLDELLQSRAPLNVPAVIEAIARALGYAHAHGVIHRDQKPSNVMVGPFGEVQVMDWDLAKVVTAGREAELSRARDAVRAAEQAERRRVVRAAEARRDVGWDAAADAVDAAGFLSDCIPVVSRHAKPDNRQRGKAARFYADAALEFLRESVAGGYKDAAKLKADPSFAPLLDNAEFRKLLAALEAKGG
jgi:hypothetical protein